ncbi:hypothetical protein [Ekhidna sp.]|uniref:hypothetical protein n=1 Tax=Ekhidna sp. TaxID=2608089 RepID=UPI003CCB76C4
MRYLLISIALLFGCKATTSAVNAPEEISKQNLLVEAERNISDEEVLIKFKNVSDGEIVLLKPLEPVIEKWTGENWEKLELLYCDCGAPCPAPPTERSIEKNGSFIFSWDRMLEKCVSSDNGMITQRNEASSGLFRVLYVVKGDESSATKLEARFSIEE